MKIRLETSPNAGLLIAAIALIGSSAGCSPVRWERNYQTGVQRAAQLGRRALVQFHSHMNPACREMDEEAFADPDVQRMLQNFVCIRVDDVMDRKLAEQFGVQVLPSFYVIRPDMTLAGSQAGKLDAEKFRIFLIKHTFD
jgi:thiol:disulfide interchange protein